ncbi:hypothetical protein AVA86_10270 [Salmonella enterica subsp. enterica serovar Livingstone]|nr:hypothetical protein [Salmonella enterica subsp. enterica serovar Livingstone]
MVIIIQRRGSSVSVYEAGRSTDSSIYTGMGDNDWWEDDDMSWPDTGSPQTSDESGYDYQGKPYDPALNEPMEVSAETHGDFWEDDIDYTETVTYDSTNTKQKTEEQAKTDAKTCKSCPPTGKVLPMSRRCSRWSIITISYQTRICNTYYNPKTKKIKEFMYCGVSFDGWNDRLCQFWEAKARYDQFFRIDGRKKGWWRGDKSAISQAARHQAIATVNQPLKVVWFFMQPISAKYFKIIFKSFKDITVQWKP